MCVKTIIIACLQDILYTYVSLVTNQTIYLFFFSLVHNSSRWKDSMNDEWDQQLLQRFVDKSWPDVYVFNYGLHFKNGDIETEYKEGVRTKKKYIIEYYMLCCMYLKQNPLYRTF